MSSKVWRSSLSKDEVKNFDKDKLFFLLEELRLYMSKLQENVGRLSNKSFVLLSLVSSMLGFFIYWIPAHLPLIKEHWALILLPLFLYLACLFYSFVTLIRVFLLPIDYWPSGLRLKDDTLKKVQNCSLNESIHCQLEIYQAKINDSIEQNNCIAGCLKDCVCLVLAPIAVFSVICLIVCVFRLI